MPRVRRPALSVCLIVRDEAQVLPRCLDSVLTVAGEVVVVDTGSQDDTPAVAGARGARLVRQPWTDDFAAARNASLDAARGEWILVLDADEELTPEAQGRLPGLLAAPPWDGARVTIRNLQPPDQLCRFRDTRVTRLFRNRAEHRYEGLIHEQIAPAILRAGGRVADVDLTILHHGYARRTAQGGAERAARDLRLLARALARTPDDAYLQYQYGAALKAAGAPAEARVALERALALGGAALDPGSAGLLHLKLAQLALANGRLPDAGRHAAASLAVAPDDVLAWCALALSRVLAGEVAAALPAIRRAIEVAAAQGLHDARLQAILAYCRAHPRAPDASDGSAPS